MSTIWLSSYCSAIAADRAKAQKFSEIALIQLDWTFRKRTAEWANAPRPDTKETPFDRPGSGEARVKGWEMRKADAAAGKALGPYAKELCEAAVGVYVRAFAEKKGDAKKALKAVAARYAGSPLSVAAETRLRMLSRPDAGKR